jgi:hypothetical protein
MQFKLNKDKEVEMVFSWKEIWILIKKRKLLFDVRMLDFITVQLIKLRNEISTFKQGSDETVKKEDTE